MKNLVVAVCGESSLHKQWIDGPKEFDLFVNYYGNAGSRYKNDGLFYDNAKGSKFLIMDRLQKNHPEVFDQYDAILIPDDDLLMESSDINRFFELFHEYKMDLAQPAIIGWMSIPIVAPTINSLIRFTTWVEIMTPCFSKQAFAKCLHTFSLNRTNWGIDSLWYKLLGNPQTSVGIIDEVVAIHTRPCFFGDTYSNNQNTFEIAWKELTDLLSEHDLSMDKHVLGSIPRDMQEFDERPSEHKFFPNCSVFLKKIQDVHNRNTML